MAPRRLQVGALVFVAPRHVEGMEKHSYGRVVSVRGANASLQLCGPGLEEQAPKYAVPVEVLLPRVVAEDEAALWPGSFVSYPIAFVQPCGRFIGKWDYGVVCGYTMVGSAAELLVCVDTTSTRVPLTSADAVIKVDNLTYALKPAAGTSAMSTNAHELVRLQDDIIRLCKTKVGVRKVIQKQLTTPFQPDETVYLLNDNLDLIPVRRQHILDCNSGPRTKRPRDVFDDPQATEEGVATTTERPAQRHRVTPPSLEGSVIFSTESSDGISDPGNIEDMATVRRENTSLFRRANPHASSPHTAVNSGPLDDFDGPTEYGAGRGPMFRPSRLEEQVHNRLAHPNTTGKDPHLLLEWVQQLPSTRFLAAPAVLRHLYDMGFGRRGLSIMHLRTVRPSDLLTSAGVTDMSDFAKRSALPAARSPSSINEVISALRNLCMFGEAFYNTSTMEVLRALLLFIEEFDDQPSPSSALCRVLVTFADLMLDEYRSRIMSAGIEEGITITSKFTRSNNLLIRLRESACTHSSIPSPPPQQAGGSTRPAVKRDSTERPVSHVPPEVLAALPKRGRQSLCMKYISVADCHGGTNGKCFSKKRGHFRPAELPNIVKSYIEDNYQGLKPEFSDL